MVVRNKASKAILTISLLTFVSFVAYILYINQEVFYTAHDRSEFIYGTPFFNTLMSKPFGIMQYAGAWMTQFFYHPALGSAMLAIIWMLIFIVGAKAFRLQGSASALMLLPVACLLVSVTDLGYWIYISPIRGYWFSQSLGYLAMLLLIWAARCTPRRWHLLWYLFAFCTYPVLGWFAMLFIVCLALVDKLTWQELIVFVILLFTPGIWHALLYSDLKFDDMVLAGLPRFVTASDKTDHLSNPFWILAGISLIIALYNKYLSKSLRRWSLVKYCIPVLCSVFGIIFTWSLMFKDGNYIREMRMVRSAEDDNWKEVLQLASKSSNPTTTMIMLRNVALMNEGGLLDRSFKMGNISNAINNPDTIHVTLLDIASPVVYYNYGMINESIRLSYENGVQAGFAPFYLKTLARGTFATGEKKQAERYTTLLQHHPFYHNWQPAPASKKIRQLKQAYSDELTGVENSDSYIINTISLWYEANSKVASEQALFYSMMRCDSHRFWPSLRKYIEMHKGEEFPVHAQEAYIMYMDKAPEAKRMMIPVEQDVYNRYKQFWTTLESMAKPGISPNVIAKQMRKNWGDTYWYYNIFGR